MSKNKFTLKRYKTVNEVRAASWGMSVQEFQNCDGGEWYDTNGNKTDFSQEEEEKCLLKMGYWGFVEENNTIHFWKDDGKNILIEDLLFFFGHEIGHKLGKCVSDMDCPKLMAEEENRADEYGLAAQLAYQFSKEII